MIGISVLIVGLLAYEHATMSVMRAQQLAREKGAALEAARSLLERLTAHTFADVFRQYNGTDVDDLAGAPGPAFAVPGLEATADDPDGLPGEILFPTPAGQPGVLTEQWADPRFGPQIDLNGANGVDADDHAGDYQLLPVVVRVRWRNRTGAAELELRTILGELL